MSLLRKICDELHAALWAILVAFVLWFSVVVAPTLPEMRARAEMLQDHEIALEQDLYCGKLGIGPGTTMYHQCVSDLEEYRAKIRERIADESQLIF